MPLALPVLFLLLIMTVLGGLLMTGPKLGLAPDTLTTSAISHTVVAGPPHP